MRNPPDSKNRPRDVSDKSTFSLTSLRKLEDQLGDAMSQAGIATMKRENGGYSKSNGVKVPGSGPIIYSLVLSYDRNLLKAIASKKSFSEVSATQTTKDSFVRLQKQLNADDLRSIYNQFKDISRNNLTKYNLNLLCELKNVFKEIERENKMQANSQVESTGGIGKRKREEPEYKNIQRENQSADFFGMVSGLFGHVATQENPPLQNPPPQAQTRDPKNWFENFGSWAINIPDDTNSRRSKKLRTQQDPQQQSNPFNLIIGLFKPTNSPAPSTNLSIHSTPSPRPGEPSSSPTPRDEFQPNSNLISFFIDKDKPSNKSDLSDYIVACDYLRTYKDHERVLEDNLKQQIAIKGKQEFEEKILKRFDDLIGFNETEYTRYKNLKQNESDRLQFENKQQKKATLQEPAQNIVKKSKAKEQRSEQQILKDKNEYIHHALNNPDWRNRQYLGGLDKKFNVERNNIDVNKKDEKDYFKKRIKKWNEELEIFGITTPDPDNIGVINLEKYKQYLKENIKNLSAQSATIENGSILRNLYSLIAFHELELRKIDYATDWGRYVKIEIWGESNTYEESKIWKILEKMPHRKYLTGYKNEENPFHKIQLPPLRNSISSAETSVFGQYLGQKRRTLLESNKELGPFTKMSIRAANLSQGLFATSNLSAGMFTTDNEVSDAIERGDIRDGDNEWRKKVKENIKIGIESVSNAATKLAECVTKRAGPATMNSNSWLHILGSDNTGANGR